MLSERQIKQLSAFLKPRMSKKRYIHSVNVAYEAIKLARRYGVDEDRAFVAGYLHDCAKELDIDEQRELARQCDLDVEKEELETPPLLHAIAGAVTVKTQLGIEDTGVLQAIRYHTTAAPNLLPLAQVIYLADLISADRDYKDVKKMRKVAYDSLEEAMLEALSYAISDDVKKGSYITKSTWGAYNEFVGKMKSSKKKKESE